MDDMDFLREAIRLARTQADTGEGGPFGAVVVRSGEIVGRGSNRVVQDRDPTSHAEIVAIRDACRNLGTHVLEGCTLYASCEPCPMCLAAIYWARVPRVVFSATGQEAAAAGFDDTTIARELCLPWEERTIRSQRSLGAEGREILETWGRNPRRTEY